MLMVRRLPALAPGSVYRVWLSRDSRRLAVGSFTVDEQGNAEVRLTLPPDALAVYDSAQITLEAEPGGSTPKGMHVATGAL